MQTKAFFYDYKYYLFPEDCTTLAEVKEKTNFTARRLKEERCMAPDFIFESIVEEEVYFEDVSRVFEVPVHLYTAKEYDEILRRQVERVCPGCLKYDSEPSAEGEEELKGHHREISLSGVCYERETEEDMWDFATCLDVFWYRIAKETNELALCIDNGDQKKLNKILNKELSKFFTDVAFYGCVEDGKYRICLCTHPHMPNALYTVYSCIAQAATAADLGPMSEVGWVVKPCRSKGSYVYGGKLKGDTPYVRTMTSGYRMIVYIYDKHADALSDRQHVNRAKDVDNYLCSVLGEAIVRTVVVGYQVVSDRNGLVTLDTCAEEINTAYSEMFEALHEETFPVPLPYSVDGAAPDTVLPFRDLIEEGVTSCSQLSFLDRSILNEPEITWWQNVFTFAYLFVPCDPEENDALATVMWYLNHGESVPEPIRNPEDLRLTACSIGGAVCRGGGFIIDFAVTCEQKFYRMLRTGAPVLSAYGAQLVVVKDGEVLQYQCGYEFTLKSDRAV